LTSLFKNRPLPRLKIILHLSRFARHVLFACLVSTALALSVVRFWLLPRAAEWREELQAEISLMTGETVHIKALSAGMRGFKPELMMRGFRIDNAAQDGPALEFERLGVGLDLPASLLSRKPVVNRIELEGGHLRLFRKSGDSFGIAGLKPSEHPPAWLFAEGEVRFSDIDLEWVGDTGGQAMPLGRAHARLRNQGSRHTLDVRVDLPGKLGKSMRLSADVEGNPLLPAGWNGRAYFEGKRLREGVFGESLKLRMRSGEAGFQAWGEWRDGVLQEVSAKLDLERPVFTWRRTDKPEGMLGLDKLAGWLRWRGQGKAWRLDGKHFVLAHNGKAWPETDFALAMEQSPDGGLQALSAAFGYLRLSEASALLGALPVLDGPGQEMLRTFSPSGEVRNARLVYQADGQFGFCGDLEGLSAKLSKDWPGVNRFTGRLCGNDRDGHADLRLAKTELNLPGLFPKPLTLDALSGKLDWHRGGGPLLTAVAIPAAPAAPEMVGPPAPAMIEQAPTPAPTTPTTLKLSTDSTWRIVGNGIQLNAPGLAASGGFALDLPAGEGESPSLEMDAQLREVDAARLRDYLPLTAMSQAAAQWHGNAYHGGTVSQADVLLRGRLADFPFPNGEGLFEAKVAANNMEVEFNPQWPRAHGVKADILFFGPTMFIDSEGGHIGDIPLKTVHAETATFIGNSWISLAGDFDLELSQALKFLQQTPARPIPQRLAKAFDASGAAHLDLQLQVPLEAGEVAMAGLLQLKNDTLALKGINLKVQGVTGELGFTENGVAGRQIAAQAMDEAVLIDVDPEEDAILLDITGKASVAALRKVFPGEAWQHAEGSFGYRLNVQAPKSLDPGSAPLRIDLASDLAGLELKLPAPLAKPAATPKQFSATLNLRRGGSSFVKLAYGQEGQAHLLFADSGGTARLESGDLSWGKSLGPASWLPGLGLALKLDTLDLGDWRKLLAETGLKAPPTLPRVLDIDVGTLFWNGEDLGPLRLAGNNEGGAFFGWVDCKYAKGSFSAENPEFGHPALQMELDSLNLPKFPDDKAGETSPDPASLPALQIHARQLLRQGADLGELELETEHWTAGMNIKHLGLRTENHGLDLRGSWMRQDGHDETKLAGNLKVRDLGGFLTLLGYGRELQSTPTESAFSLDWKDAPQNFSAAALSGEVHLKMGRGSVPQVEPGLGRALGMLNLHTLRRLLLLDFSDLFGKGLAYDGMEGTFNLEGGQARTKSFVVDAASADILLIGRVGLAQHDFDQLVSVLPHPLATLPLAVPMVGGAAVGAVIDIAHRLVGEEDLNLASSNYAVTGTWDNPQIKRVEGSTPLQIIDRTWAGIKDMAGVENRGADEQE